MQTKQLVGIRQTSRSVKKETGDANFVFTELTVTNVSAALCLDRHLYVCKINMIWK